jgi:hypothetical protein
MSNISVKNFAILSMLLFLTATACGGITRKGQKASDDWSRSVVIGEEAVGSIGISVTKPGDKIHMVWPYEDRLIRKLRFIRLNAAAEITAENDLAFTGHLRSPRLVSADENHLHLFWVTRPAGNTNWELWHDLLVSNGRTAGTPARLTGSSRNVGSYVAAADGSGGAVVVWDEGGKKGLMAQRIGADGVSVEGPVSIADSGRAPSLRIDDAGHAHMTWLDNRNILYRDVSVNDLSASDPTVVVDLDQWGTLNTTGDSLQGPAIGFAGGWVYVIWSIVSLTDTEAGSGVAEYVSFPAGSPTSLKPSRVWAIPAQVQPYVEHRNSLAISQLSEPMRIAEAAQEYGVLVHFENRIAGDWTDVSGAVSDYMLNPSSMTGLQDDLAVALATTQEKGSDKQLQIAMAVFSDGEYRGYNFAGNTSYLSDDPVLATDEVGNLYVAWREGASGETIYYASTTEEAKMSLDRLDAGDLVLAAPESIVDGLSSIAFAPFITLCWILPGLLLLGGWQLARDDNSLSRWLNWVPLGIALALYYVLKLTFLPSFTAYVPFSAWIYIPPAMEEPLRLGAPILILGLSICSAVMIRRRYGDSLLVFFFTWVAVDGLITLAIYGVNILGSL